MIEFKSIIDEESAGIWLVQEATKSRKSPIQLIDVLDKKIVSWTIEYSELTHSEHRTNEDNDKLIVLANLLKVVNKFREGLVLLDKKRSDQNHI